MATISQLMEGKVPGSVKVRRSGWYADEYFVPYFIDQEGDWRGTIEGGGATYMTDERDDWTLYTEPKRKVAMYLWAIQHEEGGTVWQTSAYYATDAHLRKENPNASMIQRLDYTKIEVEEDV